MSSFKDLINKNKDIKINGTVTGRLPAKETEALIQGKEKSNPFAKLKQATNKPTQSISLKTKPIAQKAPTIQVPLVSGEASNAKVGGEVVAKSALLPVSPPTAPLLQTDVEQVAEVKAANEFVSPDQPDGYSQEAVNKLNNALETLVNSMEHKEMISEALKNIMIVTREHPALVDNMSPEDKGLMVAGLRKSYGVVITKKSARSEKVAKNAAEVDEVMALLQGSGFSVGGS